MVWYAPMKTSTLRALCALSCVALLGLGCESASEGNSSYYAPSRVKDGETTNGASNTSTNDVSSDEGDSDEGDSDYGTDEELAAADQVDFGSLRWTYGGVKGKGSPSGVSISGLHIGGSSLSFKYNKDLSAWGYSKDEVAAYACLFVQKEDGSWVGGKFDWISSSRSSRGLENVFKGYEGWSLSGVPNPCQAAFVIVDANKKRRSNVIAGTWHR